MTLTILQVASPVMPAGPHAVGGAEQVMHRIDRALTAAGHRSVVVAPEGSVVSGALEAFPGFDGPADEYSRVQARVQMRLAIRRAIDLHRPDVVHMHRLDVVAGVPEGLPVLATLARPLAHYPPEILAGRRNLCLQPLTAEQARDLPAHAAVEPVSRGVPLAAPPAIGKRAFALVLGRIAPEKGTHLAVEAARRADMALIIAGAAGAEADDHAYFEAAVAPLLDHRRKFVGPVSPARRARLLAAARCLLAPTQDGGHGSLAAMEAMAAGTPVIAWRTGALPSIVDHGRTGFLVDDVAEMAAAIDVIGVLDGADCRAEAERRFSEEAMIARTFELYHRLAAAPVAAVA